jgi:hypothetical protein
MSKERVLLFDAKKNVSRQKCTHQESYTELYNNKEGHAKVYEARFRLRVC